MANQNWIIVGLLVAAAVVFFISQAPSSAPSLTVPFTAISQGSFGPFVEENYFVISSQADWSAFLGFIESSGRTIPFSSAIDFSKEDVIVVAMGAQRSGGHSIQVKEVIGPPPCVCGTGPNEICASCAPPVLTIFVETKSPAPGEGVIAAITTPYQVVKIQKQYSEASHNFVVNGAGVAKSVFPWIKMLTGPGE